MKCVHAHKLKQAPIAYHLKRNSSANKSEWLWLYLVTESVFSLKWVCEILSVSSGLWYILNIQFEWGIPCDMVLFNVVKCFGNRKTSVILGMKCDSGISKTRDIFYHFLRSFNLSKIFLRSDFIYGNKVFHLYRFLESCHSKIFVITHYHYLSMNLLKTLLKFSKTFLVFCSTCTYLISSLF